MQSLRERLGAAVQAALQELQRDGVLPQAPAAVHLAPPKQADHGDYTTAVALALAREARAAPRPLAQRLQAALGDAGGLLERAEVAGPGHLNLFVAAATWRAELADIVRRGGAYLCSAAGGGAPVLVEYVSANPTGPLHVAHGRGAVTGDVVANLLAASGHAVTREYYVNDLGNQTDVLARSVFVRYREACGLPAPVPEQFYPGDYVKEIAAEVHRAHGDAWAEAPEAQWLVPLREAGIAAMMERIRADLAAFGIRFDSFVSERELGARLGLDALLQRLEAGGHLYEEDGKRWFRSTAFGDDKDRVLLRDDGRPTYFLTDLAYHDDKLRRGFGRLINVWGADHGGYLARIAAGLRALGHGGEPLHVIFIQMVSLSRGGEAVRMGKRLGTAVWLRDVVDEAGSDATRYLFLTRRSDAQMDFDLDLAARRSLDNPVFYAQMGHARLCAIARKAAAAGVPAPQLGPGALEALTLPEELDLVRAMARAPEVVADAARCLEPHQVTAYVQALIAQFHSYYSRYKGTEKVISDDAAKSRARLLLCAGLQALLARLLGLLGVAAPERMVLDEEAQLGVASS